MENLRLRQTLLQTSLAERAALMAVCGEGPDGFLAWLNAFAWLYEPRADERHIPFITWPIQDRAGREIWGAIEGGHDSLLDKSRDMGASWLCLSAFVWFWLFRADTPLLMVSRKEDYVDDPGNPDSLFWKADYLVGHLPDWMQPRGWRKLRTRMHLFNPANHSVIDGESTNVDVGRGGRRKAALFDEFAAVEGGEAILAATADMTPCRLFNSTPQGRGNAFATVRFSGKVKVITLPWWEHPEKGRGRERRAQPDGTLKWWSPWYQAECDRRASHKEIAQEIDINYLESGDMFFDSDALQRLRGGKDLRPPDLAGEVSYAVEARQAGESYKVKGIEWQPDEGRKRLSYWGELIGGRPRQDWNYVAFADISQGKGASNSILDIFCVDKREQVGQWACADTPPHEFALQSVALCKWFGGQLGFVFLGWEANNDGGYGDTVIRAGYPYYYHARTEDTESRSETARYGFWSTGRTKETLLSELRRAWARAEIVTHCEATVAEAEQYIWYPGGGIGPAKLVEETAGARATHGDRVIGHAGCVLMLHEQPRAKMPIPEPPEGSYADRQRVARDTRKRKSEW